MVRKWSYLDGFNLIHAGDLAPLKALKVFKVFRKTTRFKKFNKGMTRMVRKKYAKRKYQTTWLFLTYITAAWTKNYLKSRQFERFQQSMGVFNACAYSADYDVFKVSSLGLSAEHSVNIFSCAKNISNRFINHSNMSKTILSNSLVKEAKLSFVHSTSLTSLAESELAYPVALTYENLMYHPHLENIPNSTYTNLLNTLTESTFKYSLNYVIALRQVLILMSILNNYQN